MSVPAIMNSISSGCAATAKALFPDRFPLLILEHLDLPPLLAGLQELLFFCADEISTSASQYLILMPYGSLSGIGSPGTSEKKGTAP